MYHGKTLRSWANVLAVRTSPCPKKHPVFYTAYAPNIEIGERKNPNINTTEETYGKFNSNSFIVR